jgi:hypothetical protein
MREHFAAIDAGTLGEFEEALSAIELQSKDAARRAALAPLAGSLVRWLHRGAEAPLATRVLDVLGTLSQDEEARASALAADAVATILDVAGAGASDARLAAVKALVNFTQGECKEDARVRQCYVQKIYSYRYNVCKQCLCVCASARCTMTLLRKDTRTLTLCGEHTRR